LKLLLPAGLIALVLGTSAYAQQLTVSDPLSIKSVESADAKPIPFEDLIFTRQVSSAAWSPDGKDIILSTNLTGRMNLWKVPVAGGWPIQMVQSDDREIEADWSPDGRWVAYAQDSGGNEQYQIFMMLSTGGATVNITNNPDIRFREPHFSPSSRLLAVTRKHRGSPATGIAVVNLETREVRDLTNEQTKNHFWSIAAWSPNGKSIFATRFDTSFADSSVFRIDLESGSVEELTPHSGERLVSVQAVSPDGLTLLITSNEKSGTDNVALFDLASKQATWVTNSEWSASGGSFSSDNRHFTYVVNEDGRTSAYIAERGGHAEKIAFPDGLTSPVGKPGAYSPNGELLLVSHQGAQHPDDLWVYDVRERRSRQLTFSAVASLNPALLPPSRTVHYKSVGGKIISAILWMPFNLKRDGRNPAVVLAHGGPTSQTVDSFSPNAAALASRGYIVIAPNVRGSTGYGIDFQKANYQDLGGADLQDEVSATKFLIATGYVDPQKLGITGGSYGGFMTLMALGKTPDVWAAGVEQYGVVNWYTMLQHSDPFLQAYIRGILGDPERDRAVYDAASPFKYLKNAKAPLLVLQGENDVRVPKEEAEQVVDIYKSLHLQVEEKIYAQEGHGYSRRENQLDALERMVTWFDRYLKQGVADNAARNGTSEKN
jgi:dipeptidyl aminopeptidase/acylaminoacyl peptidase